MDVAIIAVPYDLDQPLSGMGQAPDALLEAGLAERVGRACGGAVLVQEVTIDPAGADRITQIGQIQAGLAAAVAWGWPGLMPTVTLTLRRRR